MDMTNAPDIVQSGAIGLLAWYLVTSMREVVSRLNAIADKLIAAPKSDCRYPPEP